MRHIDMVHNRWVEIFDIVANVGVLMLAASADGAERCHASVLHEEPRILNQHTFMHEAIDTMCRFWIKMDAEASEQGVRKTSALVPMRPQIAQPLPVEEEASLVSKWVETSLQLEDTQALALRSPS